MPMSPASEDKSTELLESTVIAFTGISSELLDSLLRQRSSFSEHDGYPLLVECS